MNDRYKFRGKRIDNGEWVYGYFFLHHDGISFIMETQFIINSDGVKIPRFVNVEVDPKTVGQYTGLKDKDGKEIYEGDILKCKCTKRREANNFELEDFIRHSAIEWWRSFTKIGYRLRDGKGKTMMVHPSSLAKMEAEIIGNIHDNAELLEVQNG